MDKRTVSIKRTVCKNFQMTLLKVQYDLKIGGLNSLMYCTYNRDLRVLIGAACMGSTELINS